MDSKSSVNQTELNKFNRTAEQWWDKTGEFKTLHQINPTRIEYVLTKINDHFISAPFAKLSLLDVGCGGGLISVPMHKAGLNVTGLDANQQNVTAAKENANKYRLDINFIHNTVEQHAGSNNKYDVILCLEVIEHVDNPTEFLLNLASMLNQGGLLIISTINRTIKSYLLAIVMAEYVLGWVPKKTHDYNKLIKPSQLVKMLSNTKLNLQELRGLTLSLVSNEWHISNDIDVNYFAVLQG
ncbi:MAG: bifunctional 2-polyprenyl-6-hydroxyphenol methylase/3-demethylubiquinol 3-O-methyltransferase UbiG [Rickettsiaceae bacterium]